MRKIKFIPILMIMFMCFSTSAIMAASAEKHNLRVLIIEQNPMLESKGITAVEELGQADDLEAVVDEMIEDIEESSHGLVEVEIVGYENFNEFVTSKQKISLSNGSKSYTLDEDTWFEIMEDGWRSYWNNKYVKKIGEYQYDYEYLLSKFDLVERRNNDEFDQVWLVGADPINPYETVMVGNNAYWVNGPGIEKDCQNFVIMTLYVSRRDANFECFGHMAENVMRKVFGRSYDSYEKNQIEILSQSDLENLNLWERFCLTTFSTNGTYASVGNIHFAPNSEDDYDWLNKNYVESDWIDWRDNYPNLTGETIKTNYTTWCPSGKKYEACRLHHRWWFSLFPHVAGRTYDGYSNSWWDYLFTLDYAVSIEATNNIQLEEDEELEKFYFKVTYNSGKTEKINLDYLMDTLTIEDTDVVTLKKGKLIAKEEGETTITVAIDGIVERVGVTVVEESASSSKSDSNKNNSNKNESNKNNSNKSNSYSTDEDTTYEWVYASAWAIDELKAVQSQNLISKPLNNRNYTEYITREEFAITMVKLYEKINGLKVEIPRYNPFIDTDNEDVLKAYNIGITNGISENTFSPNSLITRQEIATMLRRVVDASGVYISANDLNVQELFADDSYIADWAKESIYFMKNRNIIKGKDNNMYVPLENTSIEEALVLALRTLYDCKY